MTTEQHCVRVHPSWRAPLRDKTTGLPCPSGRPRLILLPPEPQWGTCLACRSPLHFLTAESGRPEAHRDNMSQSAALMAFCNQCWRGALAQASTLLAAEITSPYRHVLEDHLSPEDEYEEEAPVGSSFWILSPQRRWWLASLLLHNRNYGRALGRWGVWEFWPRPGVLRRSPVRPVLPDKTRLQFSSHGVVE